MRTGPRVSKLPSSEEAIPFISASVVLGISIGCLWNAADSSQRTASLFAEYTPESISSYPSLIIQEKEISEKVKSSFDSDKRLVQEAAGSHNKVESELEKLNFRIHLIEIHHSPKEIEQVISAERTKIDFRHNEIEKEVKNIFNHLSVKEFGYGEYTRRTDPLYGEVISLKRKDDLLSEHLKYMKICNTIIKDTGKFTLPEDWTIRCVTQTGFGKDGKAQSVDDGYRYPIGITHPYYKYIELDIKTLKEYDEKYFYSIYRHELAHMYSYTKWNDMQRLRFAQATKQDSFESGPYDTRANERFADEYPNCIGYPTKTDGKLCSVIDKIDKTPNIPPYFGK